MKLSQIQDGFNQLLASRLWHDQLSLGVIISTMFVHLAMLVMVLTRLRPTQVQIPTFYSSLSGFSQLGPWYHLLSLPLFSLAVLLINTWLALVNFNRSRITSFYFLTASLVVAVLTATVTWAFLSVL